MHALGLLKKETKTSNTPRRGYQAESNTNSGYEQALRSRGREGHHPLAPQASGLNPPTERRECQQQVRLGELVVDAADVDPVGTGAWQRGRWITMMEESKGRHRLMRDLIKFLNREAYKHGLESFTALLTWPME